MSRNYDGDKSYANYVKSKGGRRTEAGYRRWLNSRSRSSSSYSSSSISISTDSSSSVNTGNSDDVGCFLTIIIWLFALIIPGFAFPVFNLLAVGGVGYLMYHTQSEKVVNFLDSHANIFQTHGKPICVIWVIVSIINMVLLYFIGKENKKLYYAFVITLDVFVVGFIIVCMVWR
ncbi:MAG: hypothetical protein IKQ61_06990 [Spirochaetales bacterium]|nr:hypothetical protein [Spirochaetales bacterium]